MWVFHADLMNYDVVCSFANNSCRMVSVSEMEVEMEHEDTAASASATETEDYPGTADEADETRNEQLLSRVQLTGGIWTLWIKLYTVRLTDFFENIVS